DKVTVLLAAPAELSKTEPETEPIDANLLIRTWTVVLFNTPLVGVKVRYDEKIKLSVEISKGPEELREILSDKSVPLTVMLFAPEGLPDAEIKPDNDVGFMFITEVDADVDKTV